MQILFKFLMLLQDFLEGLPGIYPYQVSSSLRALLVATERTGVTPENVYSLTTAQIKEMLVRHPTTPQVRITPAGARTLVRLYQQERLPLRMGALDLRPLPAINAYLASDESLAEKAQAAAKEAERVKKLAEDPTGITDADFSPSLLNALFHKYAAPDASVLTLGPIKVSRYVSSVAANGKKSAKPAVTFRWTTPDGSTRELAG